MPSILRHATACLLAGAAISCGLVHAQTASPAGDPGKLSDPGKLAAAAYAAYSAKQYPASIELFERAIALEKGDARASDEYNEACSLALDGEGNRALRALSDAVSDGWGEVEHTSKDPDLASLHSDPGFAAILDRMAAIRKVEDGRWGTAAFAAPVSSENLTDSDKVAGLSLLWSEAKFGFANFWHVPALDWDSTFRSFLPQVLATRSTHDYYDVLKRFYAQLQDGHSGVWSAEDEHMLTIPLETHPIDGRVLVTGLYPGSFDAQGVLPGDEVVSIDGVPVKQWAQERVAPFVGASSPQDREQRIYSRNLMRGAPGTVFRVAVRSPAGQESTHSFAVAEHGRPEPFVFRMLPGRIAYVALNEFEDNRDAEEWDRHWTEIGAASAVILDLRGNGGGSTNIGYHVLATLLDRPTPGSKQVSPEWIATYRAWGNRQPVMEYPVPIVAPDAARHFSGKVVMLIGPNTFSAAEDAVVLFSTSKRGILVGEPTGGSTGQPLQFALPGGGAARVCTKHDSFADGREFVGIGVPPDIPARVTLDDLLHGRDSVLNAGIAAARKP